VLLVQHSFGARSVPPPQDASGRITTTHRSFDRFASGSWIVERIRPFSTDLGPGYPIS
jgi:hypothetical protein